MSHRVHRRKRWAWILAGVSVLAGLGVCQIFRMREIVQLGVPEIGLYAMTYRWGTVEPGFTGAMYEPKAGCYLGAFIDLEPGLQQGYKDDINRKRKLPSEFEQHVGRKHALYFFYLGYGREVPKDWIRKLAAEDRFVQIALEPNKGLVQVQDDEYLRKLADDLASTKAKVFLRFASEMNGDWTAYHGDPKLYIEKWRLVAQVMRERAPNVAMLWCPYMVPKRFIEPYYPGDEWVDWVGVNFYSVTHYNQSRFFPGNGDHPADMLAWMYDRYAARKPLMICEYGAANYSAMENEDTSAFAIESIQALYASLPTKFPRVKCVTYFSSDNMELKDRRNNDYSIIRKPAVLNAYSRAIRSSHFLSDPDGFCITPAEPLEDDTVLWAGTPLLVYARSPFRKTRWEVHLNGKLLKSGTAPAETEMSVGLPGEGAAEIVCRAYDEDGRLVAERKYRVRLTNMKT